jgi:hypothetical protein
MTKQKNGGLPCGGCPNSLIGEPCHAVAEAIANSVTAKEPFISPPDGQPLETTAAGLLTSDLHGAVAAAAGKAACPVLAYRENPRLIGVDLQRHRLYVLGALSLTTRETARI